MAFMKRNNIIRKSLVKILKDNDWILNIQNFILTKLFTKRFLKEVKNREKLSIFEIDHLAAELPFCPLEKIADTNFYGHATAIKLYAGIKKLDYSIEHGLYFDDYINTAAYLKTTKKIMTINRERENLLKLKLNKPAIAVGPYIHYVNPLYSEVEIDQMKKSLGKTLLLFPLHSDVEDLAIYDSKSLANEIKIFAKENGFKTILVNMFYRDLLVTKYAETYKEAGFKLVTAGHRYDINFISRLKSIIMLSDYTIGNSVGTHIGYCIYMGKPHYIIDRSSVEDSNSVQWRTIGKPFTEYHPAITEEQYMVTSYYWGFECVKSKEEMNKILTENIDY